MTEKLSLPTCKVGILELTSIAILISVTDILKCNQDKLWNFFHHFIINTKSDILNYL